VTGDLREQLFEAHVQHELARWHSAVLDATVAEWVRAIFRLCETAKLDDVATRAQILGVIDRYAIEFRVSGGITELTGEMSNLVFSSKTTAETRLDEVVNPESFNEFADKVLALEGVRRELISLIAHSASVGVIAARLAARGVLDLLAPPEPLARVLDDTSLVERLRTRVLPQIERRVVAGLAWVLSQNRERVRKHVEQHLLEELDAEQLRAAVDEIWDGVAKLRLSEVFALVGEQDIEDFVVLVYEFWLRYRKTAYFRRIAAELVDHFFAKYGQETLLVLIGEMGVSESMVKQELTILFGPILAHAERTGALERLVRARLQAFYESASAKAVLSAAPRSSGE
jgi:hypothetical protein